MSNSPIRLQKFMASCGVASRRKSEELIDEGLVKVNGVIIREPGLKVSCDDTVEYNGKILISLEKSYIILNKPPGYLCTKLDDFNRQTIYDLIPKKLHNLFYMGRLDNDSSGILLLTNDGDFANNIMHPSKEIIKGYFVKCKENIPLKMASEFISGLEIDNILYQAKSVDIKSNTAIIELNEGKKREIRIVCNNFNLTVKTLQRIYIGSLHLKDLNIKEGEYKSFTKKHLEDQIYG